MKINTYKVSRKLMNDIDDWRNSVHGLVIGQDFTIENALPVNLDKWWVGSSEYNSEKNNRLIALIRYVNGEDVFEVEKPKKWVVRSKVTDDEIGSYWYVLLHVGPVDGRTLDSEDATKFDTKGEAEKWTNPLMEVVEVEDD